MPRQACMGFSTLPLANMHAPSSNVSKAFGYGVLSSAARGFFGQLTILPLLVLATEVAPKAVSGAA